jgi:hypothetical protein
MVGEVRLPAYLIMSYTLLEGSCWVADRKGAHPCILLNPSEMSC